MDLTKLRKQGLSTNRYEEIRYRQKCLGLNVLILPLIPKRDQLFDQALKTSMQQQSEGQKSDNQFFTTNSSFEHIENNRLYKYFIEKLNKTPQNSGYQYTGKVTKILQIISYQSTNKLLKKQSKISQIQSDLEKMYTSLHQFYEAMRSLNKSSSSKKINWIKENIEDKETLLEQLKKSVGVLKREIVNFYRLVIKKGYSHRYGIKWYFQQLKEIEYTVKSEDLPAFLDAQSIDCALSIYQLVSKQRKEASIYLKNRKKTKKIYEGSEFSNALSHRNLSQVYQQSKKYLKSWVQRSRYRSLSIPETSRWNKSQKTSLNNSYSTLKNNEIKRIRKIYPSDKSKKICQFLFGNWKPSKTLLRNQFSTEWVS